MLNRLLTIPLSKEKFEEELKIINSIAITNGYSVALVKKLLTKRQRKQAAKAITPGLLPAEKTPVTWRRMPFLGKVSYQLSNMFPEHIRPAFRSPNNLHTLLGNSKDKRAINSTSGVYELSYSDCQMKYVGRSGRSLRIRAAEHQRDYRLKRGQPPFSSFALHLLEKNHRSNFKPRRLHQEENSRRLALLEEVEIKGLPQQNLTNETLFQNPSPLLSLPYKIFP